MKILRKVLVGMLLVLVAIQLFHPKRNTQNERSPGDIALLYNTNDSVGAILNKACNDCHSNNTRYPWYSNFQPVAWWLSNHINDGKHELNFSEFATYSPRKQYNKLKEAVDQIKHNEMPLGSYTLIHIDARLTQDEKNALINWAQSIQSSLQSKYPPDSLARKKPN